MGDFADDLAAAGDPDAIRQRTRAVDLSNVRNAARDMVKDMVRFERNFARFQRLAAHAHAQHGSAAVTSAVNEAVVGHPDLQAKLRSFADALEGRREGSSEAPLAASADVAPRQ